MFRLWFKTFFGEPRFDEAALAHGMNTRRPDDDFAPVHAHRDSHATMVAEPEHDSGRRLIRTACTSRPWIMLGSAGRFWLSSRSSADGSAFLVPLAATTRSSTSSIRSSMPLSTLAEHLTSRGAEPHPCRNLGPGRVHGLLLRLRPLLPEARHCGRARRTLKPLYNLLEHKYWVDEIYGRLIVSPLLMFSRIVLGGLVDAAHRSRHRSRLPAAHAGLGWLPRRMQSGNIRSYAGWLALGAAAVIAVVLFVDPPGARSLRCT